MNRNRASGGGYRSYMLALTASVVQYPSLHSDQAAGMPVSGDLSASSSKPSRIMQADQDDGAIERRRMARFELADGLQTSWLDFSIGPDAILPSSVDDAGMQAVAASPSDLMPIPPRSIRSPAGIARFLADPSPRPSPADTGAP